MRFCQPFPQTVNSRDDEQALVRPKPVGAKSRVQCDQPRFIAFSPRTILLRQIARLSRRMKNLTEFPFAHNFSKTDLEVL
jgi:hypothetical protein